MTPVISVQNLTKKFDGLTAVDALSFQVMEGEVYGFLGQNGAGKSTTIRMLLTLIRPSSGSIELFGMDLHRHRKEVLQQVGAVIERPDLYKYLTALENLRIFAKMSGVKVSEKKLMEQLALVGLADRAHSKVKTYSQGMKQRLGIAIALVHDPRLIILDEPTNGLDPQGIADIRNLIVHLSQDLKKTLLVSSHLLSEMQVVSTSMLIIDRGKKLVEGKITELFDRSSTILEVQTTNNGEARRLIEKSFYGNYLKQGSEDAILLEVNGDELPAVIRAIAAMDLQIHSLHSRHSLEDYFLSLTSAPSHADAVKN